MLSSLAAAQMIASMFKTIVTGFLTLGMSLSTAASGSTGWNANPDLVSHRTKQRPEFNYDEAKVPAYELPDPLISPDGRTITEVAEWPAQRAHLLDLFREHVYGRSPGRPDSLRFDEVEVDPEAMEGKATLNRIAIVSRVQDREHKFEVILFVPNECEAPAPVFLLLNNRERSNTDPTRDQRSGFWPAEEVIDRGYAIAALHVGDLAPDNREHYTDGVIRLFEGDVEERANNAWGGLAAWAWGGQRVMDYFETDPDVDAAKVAVVGHSRGGKAALWTGAEDERFALTISNESGCGGAALSRRRFGETVQRINTNFPHWFCENFNHYNERESGLPVDQHTLVALLAPRAVYVASADEDLWSDPRGEFLSLAHASGVFGLWGHEPISPAAMPSLDEARQYGPRGYHVRSGSHNLTSYDWNAYMDLADQVMR